MVVGPITGASLNPARAFGPSSSRRIGGGATHWNQLIPVYILPGLVGAGLRRRRSTTSSPTPRMVERPIHEAVTHPDRRRRPIAAATH